MLGRSVHVASLLLLLSLLSASLASSSGQQLSARRFGSFGLETTGGEKTCTENYGFLPCSDKVGGSLFLLALYTYIFLKAAQLLLNGSELLLEVVHPGIVGGLCLPIFCTIPDAAVILVSGISGDKETAKDQVMIGMGVLAGSTVLLLTLLWGAALIVGRCDLYEMNGMKVAKSKMLTKGFLRLTETGVSTNRQTRHVAWIMVMSITPCIVVQLPQMLGLPALRKVAVIVACVLAFASFICYCVYQVMTPWIQQSMIDWHRQRYRRSHVLHRAHIYSRQNKWGDLLLNDGKLLNYDVLRRLFHFFDTNNDGQLSLNELQNFIQSLGLNRDENISEDQAARQWMEEFAMTRDGKLSLSEFEQGMANWLSSSQLQNEFFRRSFSKDRTVSGHWEEMAKDAHSSLTALLEEEEACNEQPNEANCENDDIEEGDEEEVPEPSQRWILTNAVACLVGGAALACIFAAPLVDSITSFSEASKIPSFFISFVITPLATSSSEALSSIAFATKKQRRSISVTYSQIYGSVILNNTLCLGLFLAIVAIRGLVWNFSSEVMIMGLVTAAMGCIGGVFTTVPLGLALAAFSLYPTSLALVAVLNKVCGWR